MAPRSRRWDARSGGWSPGRARKGVEGTATSRCASAGAHDVAGSPHGHAPGDARSAPRSKWGRGAALGTPDPKQRSNAVGPDSSRARRPAGAALIKILSRPVRISRAPRVRPRCSHSRARHGGRSRRDASRGSIRRRGRRRPSRGRARGSLPRAPRADGPGGGGRVAVRRHPRRRPRGPDDAPLRAARRLPGHDVVVRDERGHVRGEVLRARRQARGADVRDVLGRGAEPAARARASRAAVRRPAPPDEARAGRRRDVPRGRRPRPPRPPRRANPRRRGVVRRVVRPARRAASGVREASRDGTPPRPRVVSSTSESHARGKARARRRAPRRARARDATRKHRDHRAELAPGHVPASAAARGPSSRLGRGAERRGRRRRRCRRRRRVFRVFFGVGRTRASLADVLLRRGPARRARSAQRVPPARGDAARGGAGFERGSRAPSRATRRGPGGAPRRSGDALAPIPRARGGARAREGEGEGEGEGRVARAERVRGGVGAAEAGGVVGEAGGRRRGRARRAREPGGGVARGLFLRRGGGGGGGGGGGRRRRRRRDGGTAAEPRGAGLLLPGRIRAARVAGAGAPPSVIGAARRRRRRSTAGSGRSRGSCATRSGGARSPRARGTSRRSAARSWTGSRGSSRRERRRRRRNRGTTTERTKPSLGLRTTRASGDASANRS